MRRIVLLALALMVSASAAIAGDINTDRKTARQCRVDKILDLDLYPGIEEWSVTLYSDGAPLCLGNGRIHVDQERIDRVAKMERSVLRDEIAEIVRAYQPVFEEMKKEHDRNALSRISVGVSNAMCDRRTVSRNNTVSVTFVADSSGSLGGPAYPAMLLEQAIKLGDTVAAEVVVQLMKQVEVIGEGNCEGARSGIFFEAFDNRLLAGDIAGANRIAQDFGFVRSVRAESFHSMITSRDPYNRKDFLLDSVKVVLVELVSRKEYDRADLVAAYYHLDDYLILVVKNQIKYIYYNGFTHRELDTEPFDVTVLLDRYQISQVEIANLRISGFAKAAPTVMYEEYNRDPSKVVWNNRVDDLPYASRVEIVGRSFTNPDGVQIDAMRHMHAFMNRAGLTNGDVFHYVHEATLRTSAVAYRSWEKSDDSSRFIDLYALSIQYAMDELGFDLDGVDEQVCENKKPPIEGGDEKLGAWFLQCSIGLQLVAEADRNARAKGFDMSRPY